MVKCRHHKLAILTCAGLLLAFPTEAADNCNAILISNPFFARQLIDLSSLRPLTSNQLLTMPSSGNLSLGYVVPSYPWNSGALVLKVRHKVAANSNSANSEAVPGTMVALYREAHFAPCTNTHKKLVSKLRATSDYINYHQYKSYDDDFDAFHTEIGYRPTAFGGLIHYTRCASTTTDAVRSQFLFDDDAAVRWRPSKREVALNVQRNVREEVGTTPSFAAPSGYREYVDLQSIIVPYRKVSDQPACIGIKIRVPSYAVETDVMAVNTDDALVFSQDQDPQVAWHINWQH